MVLLGNIAAMTSSILLAQNPPQREIKKDQPSLWWARLKNPLANFTATPRGIPPEFFANDKLQIRLMEEATKKNAASCARQWGIAQYDDCSVYFAVQLALKKPGLADLGRIRSWAKDELGRFYEHYLKSSTTQKVSEKYFIKTQVLEKVLFQKQFGAPLKSNDIEQILERTRKKTGLSHIPPQRKKALTWEEIASSPEPIEVRIQDIPLNMQEAAKKITLPKKMAEHLEIPEGGSLWDFIVKSTDSIVFAKQIPTPPSISSPMLAEAKTLFFKTAVIATDDSKQLLGPDFLIGLLSSLSHESYHNFYLHRIESKNEEMVDAYTLNERNAHLLGAEVSIQLIRKLIGRDLKSATDKTRLDQLMSFMANDLMLGIAANECLHYNPDDKSLRLDIPPDVNRKALSRHPQACVLPYLMSQKLSSPEEFYKKIVLMSEIY